MRPFASRSRLIRRASTAAVLLADSTPSRRYARFMSYFLPDEKQALLSREFSARLADQDSYSLVENLWDAHRDTDPVNRLLAVDTHSYLPGDLLTKVDITTMSVSLEARSPFLDHTFMEWAATLPGGLKVHRGTTKYLMKRALEPWLPADLIHRRKMGFAVPLAAWLRGPLRDTLYDLLTDQTARDRGWFRPGAVRELLTDHMAGHDRSPHLYALLMLELWQREVLSELPKVAQ
jgi:asparagine synthase (glutamine-hydrolysing)